MLAQLKDHVHSLIQKHGAEVGMVAKIAAHTLIPGAPMLIGATEALCDFVAGQSEAQGKNNENELNTKLEALGDDITQLDKVMKYMSNELEEVMSQMTHLAQFGTPPKSIEAMLSAILESQFSDLRDELRSLTPELKTVRKQGERMLQAQALQGDMLRQVQDQLDIALSYNEPLVAEGVVGADVGIFLGARGRFQNALISGDLDVAQTSLDQMRLISPYGNTLKISEMALRAARRDFIGAETVARSVKQVDDPRLQRALTSLTSLTQASSKSMTPPIRNTSNSPDVGQIIGARRWELKCQLGRGGMGEVWRAINFRKREGALKLMSVDLGNDQTFVNRFQAEIDALDRVSHPAVVDILDWGQDQVSGAWYFVMPFIEGMSLRAKISRDGLSEKELKSIMLALTDGLIACHDAGVIHRDIKPDNIMITVQGEPILIDFGIAHQEGQSSGQTTMATGGYAPPEQLAGRPVDATADLYALGMTLAECLGTKSREDIWSDIISQLTHFAPERRGTAKSLKALLDDKSTLYHVAMPGQSAEGPLKIPDLVKIIIANEDSAMLWWPEANTWTPWRDVKEVRDAVQSTRLPNTLSSQARLTPPPLLFSEDSTSQSQAPNSNIDCDKWDLASLDELQVAAEDGNMYAQAQLALYFEEGEGVEQNLEIALKWLKRSADQGHTWAERVMGDYYYNGEVLEQSYEEAINWYRKAASKNDADAQNSLGDCYYYGDGVEENDDEAIKWWFKAAEQGHKDAQDNLGNAFKQGNGVKQDFNEAVNWYRKAALQGYPLSQFNLGLCYEYGTGVSRSLEQSFKWYYKAAKQGYPNAQHKVSVCYQTGKGIEEDQGDSIKWLLLAAEQGYVLSQFKLARRYSFGTGIEKNIDEAFQWYTKAANQGHSKSQVYLGILISQGHGGDDDKKASSFAWYMKSAEQGDPKGQCMLAFAYKERDDVDSLKEAAKWFKKSAEQGNMLAQGELGRLYLFGDGVDQDSKEALIWLNKAKEQGCKSTQELLDRLKES